MIQAVQHFAEQYPGLNWLVGLGLFYNSTSARIYLNSRLS